MSSPTSKSRELGIVLLCFGLTGLDLIHKQGKNDKHTKCMTFFVSKYSRSLDHMLYIRFY